MAKYMEDRYCKYEIFFINSEMISDIWYGIRIFKIETTEI